MIACARELLTNNAFPPLHGAKVLQRGQAGPFTAHPSQHFFFTGVLRRKLTAILCHIMRRWLPAFLVAVVVLAMQWRRSLPQRPVIRTTSSSILQSLAPALPLAARPPRPPLSPATPSLDASPSAPLPLAHVHDKERPTLLPGSPPVHGNARTNQAHGIHLSIVNRNLAEETSDFAGAPSLEDRDRLLHGCRGPSKCGFMAASGYDSIAAEATKKSKRCTLVVATAIFGRKDKLQQPEGTASAASSECFFAIVDDESATFFMETASPSLRRQATADPLVLSRRRVGIWRLLVLQLSRSPYPGDPRRASRVPKLLPFRLFPHARYFMWIDGKLKLLVPPMDLVRRYLVAPRAALALPRNLRRDRIDEEMDWIRGTLSAEPQKLQRAEARRVEAQWRFYVEEQRNKSAQPRLRKPSAGEGDDEEWMRRTSCAEGAMILADLQSDTARCVLCAWFNEWHRFGERDQLALSYVLHAMDRTPLPPIEHEVQGGEDGKARAKRSSRAHHGVFFWPRKEHWNYKPRAGEAKPRKYVRYVGHGGCLDRAQLDRTGRRSSPNKGC